MASTITCAAYVAFLDDAIMSWEVVVFAVRTCEAKRSFETQRLGRLFTSYFLGRKRTATAGELKKLLISKNTV